MLPAGVQPVTVMDDVQRLARMSTVYRSIKQSAPDIVYWQYTSLESGLHSCYPGHGGYPSDFDPHKRLWYREAKEGSPSIWTPPYMEVSTHRPVVTARAPVRRPDGSFAGVTAIDIVIPELLERFSLPGMDDTHMKIVMPRSRDLAPGAPMPDPRGLDPSTLGLFVLGETSEEPGADTVGDASSRTRFLETDDIEGQQTIIRDMLAGRSGVRHMDYEGQPSIWAYGGSAQQRVFLLAIVPRERVTAEAARAEQTVLSQVISQLRLTLAVLGVVALVIVVITFAGSRSVTEPVRRLAAAARRIAEGDFTETHVDVRTRDEIGELGHAFNEMIPQLQDRLQMRHALALAMEVQQHLLPRESPRVEGLDIAGRSIYCDETGGDYYDFVHLEEFSPHEVGVAVGDVTGHGVAAALMMTGARALLRSRAAEPGSIGELLRVMNRHLTEDTPVGRFMTLFYLKIDTSQRSLHWGSAGHDPAIVYRPDTDRFTELAEEGIPLGIDAGWTYHESRRDELNPGEIIVIGTDGIWETRNSADEQFGKDRLRELIRAHARASARTIGTAIHDAVVMFRGGMPQEDDITFVVIRVERADNAS
jgi:sigma-B regulation protein RsbU (phosphoserine phosphatase)